MTETKKKNSQQKTRLSASPLTDNTIDTYAPGLSIINLAQKVDFVKFQKRGHEGNRTPATRIDSPEAVPTACPLFAILSKSFELVQNPCKIAASFLLAMTVVLFAILPTKASAANSGIFTAELWVKPTSAIASQALVGKAEELRVFTDASGNAGCQIKSTTWQTASTGTIALTLNSWSHVACAYDKSTLKIYVNGVLAAQTSLTSQIDDTTNAIKIGQDDSASTPYSNLTGVVDGFEFYNYARTQQQITEDMNAGHPTGGSPLGSQVGFWKFDEGYGTTAHNSGNTGSTDNGTLSGTTVPSWTNSAKFGRALTFNGTSAYVGAGNDSSLQLTSSLTLSAWINLTNTSSVHDIAAKDGASGQYGYRLFTDASGKLNMEVSLDGTALTTVTGATTLSSSTWYHVLGVYNPGTSLTVYVNGNQDGQNTTSIPSSLHNSTANLEIGSQNGGSANLMNGTIDEVKLYSSALTSQQVLIDMNRNSSEVLGALSDTTSGNQVNSTASQYCIPGDSSTCTGPVGEWNFEEGHGTTVNDTSGNGNTGTWNGTGSHWSAPSFDGGWAGNFDGTDDYVSTNLQISPAQYSSVTIESWVYPISQKNGFGAIMAADDGGYDRAYGLNKTDGKYEVQVGNSYWEPVAYTTNTWQHVVVVYTSSSITFYLNGTSYSFGSGGTFGTSAQALQVGEDSACGTCYFTGHIDQAKVYNYARTPAQIAWDYNHGQPVGWWKFDECQGSVANDSSGNGNNGTITIGSTGTQTAPGTCTDGLSTSAWNNGRVGKINSSLNFDGTDDNVSIPNSTSLSIVNTITVSMWVMLRNPHNSYERLIEYGHGAWPDANWSLVSDGTNGNDSVYFCVVDNSNNQHCSPSSSNFTTNTWHFITGTYDGNYVRLYADGEAIVPIGVGFYTGTIKNNNSPNLYICSEGDGSLKCNADIDDVRIYNYALTPLQVKLLYNNGAINFSPVTGTP